MDDTIRKDFNDDSFTETVHSSTENSNLPESAVQIEEEVLEVKSDINTTEDDDLFADNSSVNENDDSEASNPFFEFVYNGSEKNDIDVASITETPVVDAKDVQEVQEDKSSNKSLVLGIISSVLLLISVLIALFTGVSLSHIPEGTTIYEVTEVIMSLLIFLTWFSSLIIVIVMRIQYKKSIFGKVLMIIHIVLFVLTIISIIIMLFVVLAVFGFLIYACSTLT